MYTKAAGIIVLYFAFICLAVSPLIFSFTIRCTVSPISDVDIIVFFVDHNALSVKFTIPELTLISFLVLIKNAPSLIPPILHLSNKHLVFITYRTHYEFRGLQVEIKIFMLLKRLIKRCRYQSI